MTMRVGNTKKDYKPNDECYTPDWIFQRLGIKFDLDVCAPKGGLDWIPAKTHFSKEDDGLVQPWVGRVWMNPPYSQPKEWVAKWLKHNNGFALLPVSKSAWYSELWDSEAKCVVLPYNVRFIKPDSSKLSIFMPTMIWAINETNVTILKQSGLGRIR